jgi:O-antigen ligase
VHFWLLFLLILSMRDWPGCWHTVMLGLCALLSIEAVGGIVGFVQQSTASLEPFKLTWPGLLDASSQDAVRVRLPGGVMFLRAYGTVPHPNILGGLALSGLMGPIALFLRDGRQKYSLLFLTGMGAALLLLTFSRSTWLGLTVFLAILVYHSKHIDRRKLAAILLVIVVSFGLTLLPLRSLFLNRTVNSATERFTFASRLFLTGHALNMIREHPILGVGMGSFVIELARQPGPDGYVEAAHNIPLLIAAELGIFGIYFVFIITVMIGRRILQGTEPRAILSGALLTGFGMISLFDHYLWTLAPGRILLALALGLWMGQVLPSEQAQPE